MNCTEVELIKDLVVKDLESLHVIKFTLKGLAMIFVG